MVCEVVSERPLGAGREVGSEREQILLNVSRWIRQQNRLFVWTAEARDWHDRVVAERPAWAVDLIDAEKMEKERWGLHSQR